MQTKTTVKWATIGFSALSLLLFLTSFIPNYVLELEELPQAYSYFVMYFTELEDWITATVAAVFFVVTYTKGGKKVALRSAIPLTLAKLFYTIPYYYLLGISYKFDSIESIMLSLIASIFHLLVFYLHSVLLFFVAKYVFTRREKVAPFRLSEGSVFDLDHSATLSIFAISFAEFVIRLLMEIRQAVSYFIEYVGDYLVSDILYMVFRFIFILAMIFVSHFVCFKVKNLIFNSQKNDI